jgi:uncharacterized protein (DUF1015 family)
MAKINPFRALRYDPARVNPAQTVTQPYDKITPAMQEAYYQVSPFNLVRIILGKREPDEDNNNVYTRAADCFRDWRRQGIFLQDAQPSLYAYSQKFRLPGDPTEYERRSFIAIGDIEEYSANVVFRHEQTLSKPKADRLNLLQATRAHFGQIFMLYSDSGEIDSLLATNTAPDIEVTDEYRVVHRVWKISDSAIIDLVRSNMRDKKLIIADGHHRYETALTYRNQRRAEAESTMPSFPRERSQTATMVHTASDVAAYERVMMTFVNMNSPGLVILPTHRVVHSLASFSSGDFHRKARTYFDVEELGSRVDAQQATSRLREAGRRGTALLALTADRDFLLTNPHAGSSLFAGLSSRQQALDVVQLHKVVLETVLGLSEESIRNQENISYLRDAGEAIGRVRNGQADVAFLMNPIGMAQMRDVAFAGEVLPQKSTDFYPKMLTGLTIYALE